MARKNKRTTRRFAAGILLASAGIGIVALLLYTHPTYIYIPERDKILNPDRNESTIRAAESADGPERMDEETLELGRRAFYGETFGNEHFLMGYHGAAGRSAHREGHL